MAFSHLLGGKGHSENNTTITVRSKGYFPIPAGPAPWQAPELTEEKWPRPRKRVREMVKDGAGLKGKWRVLHGGVPVLHVALGGK